MVGMISTIVLVFEVEGITVPPARADFIACVMAHPVGSRVIRPEQGSGGGRFGKMCSSSPLSLNKSRVNQASNHATVRKNGIFSFTVS
jgi:hypothetical protein